MLILRGYAVSFLLIATTLSFTKASNIYKEIYPALRDSESEFLTSHHYCDQKNTSHGTCPLFIGFLISFGGSYKSNGGLPGVQIALDEINGDPDMLPGYTLHYTLKDSNCNREVAFSSFFTQMFQPPTKLGVVGAGCSVATEPTAEVVSYYNLTQISCVSSSPSLSNRIQFKTYFQLLASESFLAYGYFEIVRHFGWRKVAIITQEESLFTYVMDLVTEQLRAEDISYSEIRFPSSGGVKSLEDRLFDPEARIFLLSMYTDAARELLCRAYQEGVYYPRYQFIMVGWYRDQWWVGDTATQQSLLEEYDCTVENREQVLSFALTVVQDEFIKNFSKVIDSGSTGEKFLEDYQHILDKTTHDIEPSIYGQQCYDATWSLARALNNTMTELDENDTLNALARQYNQDLSNSGEEEEFRLQHFTYNNSAILDLMFENIARTDFIGLTGRINFNNEGIKKIQYATIEQYRLSDNGLEKMQVAVVDFSNTSNLIFLYEDGVDDTNLWMHGEIPYDGVPNLVQATVEIGVTVVFSILAAAGIVFAVVCLVFNFAFRKTKFMKLSSPNLNYLIGAGAIIIYIDIYFFIVPTTDPYAVTILCNITPWLSSLGYSLCFGTIIMKMGRVFYIFNNAMSTVVKKTIHDWMLGIGVLILLILDILVLSIYSIVDRKKLAVVSVASAENAQDLNGPLGIITNYFIFICDSPQRNNAISVLYGFKALIQIIALIFAFSTRKVNIKGLDDSPFIIAAIYVSSIVLAVIFVSSITLKDFENAFAIVYCSGFFIGTTVIVLLAFIPKMVTLYRDPKGEKIFKNIAPPSEVPQTTQEEEKKFRRISSVMFPDLQGR